MTGLLTQAPIKTTARQYGITQLKILIDLINFSFILLLQQLQI
jgi:hypothetical protein